MTAEDKIITGIKAELERQAANSDGALLIEPGPDDDQVVIRGQVDLAALAMVAVGSIAGGP
jgi:hypothetical protein